MRCIDGHTFDETLLRDGWVIDAGCRGWNFTNWCIDNHKDTLSIDIEDFKQEPLSYKLPQHKIKQAALTNYSGQTECYLWGNGTGNFIKGINGTPGNTPDRPVKTELVPAITLQDIYKEIGTDIDLLKLDIEGAEYLVLEKFEPIPKQITVEFHEHCHPHLHEVYFISILENLCKHYHAHFFNVEPKYHFLDCLFIRKDIL
jgi:FkbM family methyltransferase